MKTIQLKVYLIAIVFLFGVYNVCGQNRIISYGNSDPSSVYFEVYKPKQIKSLDELPPDIKSKIENHLQARFGNNYYSKLNFLIAEIIDVDELFRVEPKFKSYQWKMHTYEFVFKYSDMKKGLSKYFARIRLDLNGDVMHEIDLPEVKKYPQKADLISVDKAIEIAKSKGFKPKKMQITILYDEDVDSLAWNISTFANEDRFTITRKVIKIDAHNGEILKEGTESGIK